MGPCSSCQRLLVELTLLETLFPHGTSLGGQSTLANGRDPEVKPLALLKAANDLKPVLGLRIAVRAEHAQQALRRLGGQSA